MFRFFRGLAAFCLICAAFALTAPATASADEAKRDPMVQYNELAAKRAELMIEVRKLDIRLSTAWQDPKLSNEEIDALREEVSRLETELLKARKALREEVARLSEIKETRKKRDAVLKEAQVLTDQMNTIIPRRRVPRPVGSGETIRDDS